jgi:DNA adenine methylase
MFVLYNLGFSGKADTMGDWRIAKSNNVARTFANRVDRLDWYVERFRHVTIDNRPALKVLDVYDSQDTVFYCDPPYIPETRKSGGYRCEMDTADHEDLIKKLLTVKGRVVLSGYDSPRYRPLVNAGWKTRRFATRCIAMNNKVTADRNRKECLWISPD